MTICAGFLEDSVSDDVSDTDGTFTAPGPESRRLTYLVSSGAVVHLARNRAATTDDFRVPAETVVEISLFGTETLHYVVGDGESDNTIWISRKE